MNGKLQASKYEIIFKGNMLNKNQQGIVSEALRMS